MHKTLEGPKQLLLRSGSQPVGPQRSLDYKCQKPSLPATLATASRSCSPRTLRLRSTALDIGAKIIP